MDTMPAPPDSVSSSATQNWAISAIVLASLCLLFGIGSMVMAIFVPSPIPLSPAFELANWILPGVNNLAALIYLIGGIQTVRGIPIGPQILKWCAIGGSTLVIVANIHYFLMVNTDSYKTYMDDSMSKAADANPAMANTMANFAMVPMLSLILTSVIQIAYNIGLYLQMAKNKEEKVDAH